MNKRQLGAAITLAVAFSGTSVLPAMAAEGDSTSSPASTTGQASTVESDTKADEPVSAPATDEGGSDEATASSDSGSVADESDAAPSAASVTSTGTPAPPTGDSPVTVETDSVTEQTPTNETDESSGTSPTSEGSTEQPAAAAADQDDAIPPPAEQEDVPPPPAEQEDAVPPPANQDDQAEQDNDDQDQADQDNGGKGQAGQDGKEQAGQDGKEQADQDGKDQADQDGKDQADQDGKDQADQDKDDQDKGDPAKPAKPTPKPARLSIAGSAFAKDANHNGRRDAGDIVTFRYTVTNTGKGEATGVTVTSGLGATTCGRAILPPGSTAQCTLTYSISQSDMDRGSVTDRASARAVGADKKKVSASSGAVSVDLKGSGRLAAAQGVTQVTDLNRDGHAGLGDKLRYTLQVTNTGSLTVTGLSITDSKLSRHGVNFSCPTSTLAPGATVTCTSGLYTVNRWESKNSPLTNHAVARGTTPRGVTIASNHTVTYRLTIPPPARVHHARQVKNTQPKQHTWVARTQSNHVTRVKPHKVRLVAKIRAAQWVSKVNDKNKNGRFDAGDSAVYSFKVVNVGNLTVSNVTIVDRKLTRKNLKITCDRTTLVPGATAICHAEKLVFTKWQAKHHKPLGKNWAYATAVASTGEQIRSNGTKTDRGVKAKADPEPSMLAFTGIHAGELLLSGVFLVGAGAMLRAGSRRRTRRS